MERMADVTEQMCGVFTELKAGELERHMAKELSNAAGKIIGSSKVRLEYQKMRGNKKIIKFLEEKEE